MPQSSSNGPGSGAPGAKHPLHLKEGQEAWVELPDGRTVPGEVLQISGGSAYVRWRDGREAVLQWLEGWRCVPMRPG